MTSGSYFTFRHFAPVRWFRIQGRRLRCAWEASPFLQALAGAVLVGALGYGLLFIILAVWS